MTNPGDFTFGRAELEAAVAKGVLDRNAADNLTEFLLQNRDAASDPDEERLRLITGFNDIFVTIGIALFLGALYYLLGYGLQGSLGVAVASWGLAEVFTKRKRMALPSIVLLVTFVLSSAVSSWHFFAPDIVRALPQAVQTASWRPPSPRQNRRLPGPCRAGGLCAHCS